MTKKANVRSTKTRQAAKPASLFESIYSPGRRAFLSLSPNELSIGGRLRRERLIRNMSLEKMAAELDISSSYLGAMERGYRPISRRMMDKLHDTYNLSYDFLMEGVNVSGEMVTQFVREKGSYSIQSSLDTLLRICDPEELACCYSLVHTYLARKRSTGPDRSLTVSK